MGAEPVPGDAIRPPAALTAMSCPSPWWASGRPAGGSGPGPRARRRSCLAVRRAWRSEPADDLARPRPGRRPVRVLGGGGVEIARRPCRCTCATARRSVRLPPSVVQCGGAADLGVGVGRRRPGLTQQRDRAGHAPGWRSLRRPTVVENSTSSPSRVDPDDGQLRAAVGLDGGDGREHRAVQEFLSSSDRAGVMTVLPAGRCRGLAVRTVPRPARARNRSVAARGRGTIASPAAPTPRRAGPPAVRVPAGTTGV